MKVKLLALLFLASTASALICEDCDSEDGDSSVSCKEGNYGSGKTCGGNRPSCLLVKKSKFLILITTMPNEVAD